MCNNNEILEKAFHVLLEDHKKQIEDLRIELQELKDSRVLVKDYNNSFKMIGKDCGFVFDMDSFTKLFESQKEFDGKCPLCGANTCGTYGNGYWMDVCLEANEGCGAWQGNYRISE